MAENYAARLLKGSLAEDDKQRIALLVRRQRRQVKDVTLLAANGNGRIASVWVWVFCCRLCRHTLGREVIRRLVMAKDGGDGARAASQGVARPRS
jgi:hypothetical protein